MLRFCLLIMIHSELNIYHHRCREAPSFLISLLQRPLLHNGSLEQLIIEYPFELIFGTGNKTAKWSVDCLSIAVIHNITLRLNSSIN